MKILGLFFILLTLTSCAVNPVSGQQNFVMMSESQEIAMGRSADADVRKQYGVYDSPKLQAYVNEVGQRIARNSHRPNLQYHFTVLDSTEINAFALPGGYIYITRGILPYLGSEAELAAVLGHEVGHVTARHGVQQYTAAMAANVGVEIASIFVPELKSQIGQNLTNIIGGALLSGYGREHELEADKLGSEYLARTHYEPHAMIQVLRVLKNQELFDAEIAKRENRQPRSYHGVFASHPDSDTRLQQVVGEADDFLPQGTPIENREAYLSHLEGLIYGDNPSQGVVRKNSFFHSGLNIGLDFPKDWKISNTPDKLIAVSPKNDAKMEVTLAEDGEPADLIEKTFGRGNLRLSSIHGLQAAQYSSSSVEACAVKAGKNVFLMTGAARSAETLSRERPSLSESMHSFRRLNESERKLAEGERISIHRARSGESFAQYAKDSPIGKYPESILRLLNGAYPNGEPSPGQSVKIVQ